MVHEPADLSLAEADESKLEKISARKGNPSPAVEQLRENSCSLENYQVVLAGYDSPLSLQAELLKASLLPSHMVTDVLLEYKLLPLGTKSML